MNYNMRYNKVAYKYLLKAFYRQNNKKDISRRF